MPNWNSWYDPGGSLFQPRISEISRRWFKMLNSFHVEFHLACRQKFELDRHEFELHFCQKTSGLDSKLWSERSSLGLKEFKTSERSLGGGALTSRRLSSGQLNLLKRLARFAPGISYITSSLLCACSQSKFSSGKNVFLNISLQSESLRLLSRDAESALPTAACPRSSTWLATHKIAVSEHRGIFGGTCQ